MKRAMIKQFVINRMIEANEWIYSELQEDGSDLDEPFNQYMIKKDYRSAFDICCSTYTICLEMKMFDDLKELFFPELIRKWSVYRIQYSIESDDFDLQDVLLNEEITSINRLTDLIFGAKGRTECI